MIINKNTEIHVNKRSDNGASVSQCNKSICNLNTNNEQNPFVHIHKVFMFFSKVIRKIRFPQQFQTQNRAKDFVIYI